MNLKHTWNWLKTLWTLDHIDLSEWFKEGLVEPTKYKKGMSWLE